MRGRIGKFFKSRSFYVFLFLFMAVAGYGTYKCGTGAEAADEHMHDVSADCGHDSAVTFTEWTEMDRLPDTAGSYFLSADVMLTDTWTISSGTINLCLNGYQIKLAASTNDPWMEMNSIVKLTGGAELNLCDCSAGGTGKINGEEKEGIPRHAGIYVNGAVFNMYGGQITGNKGCYMTGPGNSSLVCGGGLYVESGEVHLYGGSITKNTAKNYGGGIYAVSNSKIVLHSEKAVISNNQSSETSNGSSYGDGGGIYLEGSSLCLEQGIISGNSAGNYGGGIHAENNSEIQIKGGIISKNKAQGGGGIYAREGKALLLSGGNIQENEARSDGGGFYLYKNDITMLDGKISGNICRSGMGSAGGGIEVMQGVFHMSGGEICENSSEISAGGVYIYDGSSFIMSGGIISKNKVVNRGGGLLITGSGSSASLSGNAKIQDNEAQYYGGGVCIWDSGSSITVTGGEISGNKIMVNQGYFNGAGICVQEGTCNLSDSPVIKNNTKAGTGNNIYLKEQQKIIISGKLEEAVLANPIGITMEKPGVFTDGWTGNMSGEKAEEYFVSDETKYGVGLKEGEGMLGCSLLYMKPEGVSGTVPEMVMYLPASSVQIEENTLTKKGYKAVGWSETENGTELVSSAVTINKSMTLYPVFSRNFTGKNEKIDLKGGKPINPVDLNQFVSFEEGVTETEKDFQFEISGTSQLPEGLQLENGRIVGTPGKAGETEITIGVQDRAAHGQSGTFVLTFVIEMVDKQAGTASVSQKNLHCGESTAPVPVSATNGTEHVTYYYKPAEAADAEYTEEAPTAAGEYIVRAVFAETDTYKEVTAEARFTISHKYGEAWERDENSHWHVCACGEKEGEENHKEDAGTVTKEPSAEGPGEKTYKCSICGLILRTEELPYVNTGKIEKEIERGDNSPEISVPITLKELAEMVLTQEEQESVEKGVDIKIILTIADAEKFISNTDKEIVQAALNDFEKGQYLDISLFKQIDGIQNRIAKTNSKIRIVLEIPAHLRGDDTDKRTFAIIRVHDGKAAWLKDLDNDRNTITIETDSFSTYVLVYQDEGKPDDNKPDDNKPDDNQADDKKPDGNTADTDEKNSNSGTGGGGNEAAENVQKSGTAKRGNAVKTGDSAKTGFWLAVLILSGTACPLLSSGIRKRRGKKA